MSWVFVVVERFFWCTPADTHKLFLLVFSSKFLVEPFPYTVTLNQNFAGEILLGWYISYFEGIPYVKL